MPKTMPKTLFAALATAAILTGGILTAEALAMTPSRLGLATGTAAPVQLAAVICGTNGCAAVPTKHQPRRKFQTLGHG